VGFPQPPFNQHRPRKRLRMHRTYRAGADHYVMRLFGWQLIFRLERQDPS
jgi:hypothetical protein